MPASRLRIAPEAAEIIRGMHPELKRSVRSALRALGEDPALGEPLRWHLEGLWKYRVRRYRIVYAVDPRRRLVDVVAIGHRRSIYEELTERHLGGGRAPRPGARATRSRPR